MPDIYTMVPYIIIFAFGLVVGAFINVLIFRIPLKRPIFTLPFVCEACGEKLAAVDVISVANYLLLNGKCRHCGNKIPPRYPLVEVVTAAVFCALYYKYGFTMPFVAYAFLMSMLISVFFIDIDHRIIPNGLVIAGMAGGTVLFAYNCLSPMPEIFGNSKWWAPLAGILPGSVFLFIIAAIGNLVYKAENAMGMGDVKLMAPIGMFVGWRLCFLTLFVSVVLGGLASAALLLLRVKKRRDTVPFAPFIVAGTFFAIMWGEDFFSLCLV